MTHAIPLTCTSTNPRILMVDEREKKVILLVACLASFLVPYTGSSITVALPAIAAQFNADAVTLGWITSAYIVSAALFIVPFGRLADILGRKKIFILGILIFTVASLASALAPSAGFLIAARFVQGIGGAMLFATSVAMVTQVYGPGERGRALGITIATVYRRPLHWPVPWRYSHGPFRVAIHLPDQCPSRSCHDRPDAEGCFA